MNRAVKESWRAAAWMLERKCPRDFAKVHPRMIDPLDLEASLGQVYDAVFRSIRDPLLRRKVARNIEKSLKTELHELATDRRSPRPPKPKKERPFDPDPFVDTDDNDELSGATGRAAPGSAGGSRSADNSCEYSIPHSEFRTPHSDSISSVSIPNSTVPIPLFDLPAPNTFEDAPDIHEPPGAIPNSTTFCPETPDFCPETSDKIPAAATPSPAEGSDAAALLDAAQSRKS